LNVPLSTYTLLADVGGTHTRCAVAIERGVDQIEVFNNADFDLLQTLLQGYVTRHASDYGAVDAVILGVAGLVKDDRVQLLNRDWGFSASDISAAVGVQYTRLVNDFEALAYSLPDLPDDQLSQCGGVLPLPHATKVVLGAGTGLGVSCAVWSGAHWLAVPGEGGHVSLAACNEREGELCRYLRKRFNHASAERALSGSGLSNIYHFISGEFIEPAKLSALAYSGDVQAREAFDLFFALLGNVASNLALTLGASGGVYIGGGVIKKNRGLVDEAKFRRRFDDKGRYKTFLQSIPVYWITGETPALTGLYHLYQNAQVAAP